jgi:zinc transporter
MHEIVTGSGNVSRLMDDISASTSEQEKGISQITLALSELERVTQSNVAMAEELNGSSDVLRNQVIELQTRTRNFRLDKVIRRPHLLCRLAVLPPAATALTPLPALSKPGMPGFFYLSSEIKCTIPERFQRDAVHSCCLTPTKARLTPKELKGGGAVESIKGSELNVPDAVFAWVLDGRGGARPLEDNDVIDSEHPCWLHLNYTHPDSADWLASTPLLPNNVRDALAGESLRPRVSRMGDGTLITLRCINGSTDERPDQLVAMRVYMDDGLIVSTRQRKVLALDDIVNDLKEGTGPVDCGSWLVDVCDALTDHASEFIEELHDKIIDLEDNLLDQQIPPRGFLALLRKQLIVMRRYMTPQRDVYARLASERLAWMNDDQRRRMQDIADRLGRGLDEIDSCIARTAVMADEIAQVMQESLARRTYTMSLMAMVFLPSTFLTGLFGVNLGEFPVALTIMASPRFASC